MGSLLRRPSGSDGAARRIGLATLALGLASCGGRAAGNVGDAGLVSIDGGPAIDGSDPRGYHAATELASRWLAAHMSGYALEIDETDPARGLRGVTPGERCLSNATCARPLLLSYATDRASLSFEFACDQAGPSPTSSDLQRALRWVIVDALTIDVGAQAWTFQSYGSDRLVQGITFLPSAAGRVRIAIHTTMHDLVGRSTDSDCQGADGAPEFCITGAQGPIPLDLTLDLPFDRSLFEPISSTPCQP